ncbi:hypothetical protein GIW70_07655 [Pseudomonas syringae]|nr:hypothetical protein [Pseudomonas syringae]MCF5068071.1 hypothetical protein [Pseudomonas syringae]
MSTQSTDDETPLAPLVINLPTQNAVVGPRVTASGNCDSATELSVQIRGVHYPPYASGQWSVTEVLSVDKLTPVTLLARQGASSVTRQLYVQPFEQIPEIQAPANGAVFSTVPIPIRGVALTGSVVTIKDTRQGILGTVTAGEFGEWSTHISPSVGELIVTASQAIPTGTPNPSAPCTFAYTALIPTITSPDDNSFQNDTFTLGGIHGLVEGVVEVLIDLSEEIVGSSQLLTQSSWTAPVKIQKPGIVSLVARNVKDGEAFGRSAPRAFKIRPPYVKSFNAEWTLESLTFHGEGYEGATILIVFKQWPGDTPPAPLPLVVVKEGTYEMTVPRWPYGVYLLEIAQKLPDGAGGWIESNYSDELVNLIVAEPTATYVVNERIPTFTGTGISNATIIIADDKGDPVGVSNTTVFNGIWSVTADIAWAPVTNRVIHVVQEVDGHRSLPCVLEVTIDPLELPTDVDYRTEAYKPVFSGRGVVGATVFIQDENGVDVAQPLLLTTTTWTIPAKDIWGPTSPARKIHVLQKKDGLSSERVTLDVSIALLAPEITEIIDVTGKDLHVRVKGTGWTGAQVTLTFSDSAAAHLIDVREGNWEFERTTPFVPATVYTATAIQKFGGQVSPVASKSFEARLPAPTITYPGVNDDEWRDLTVIGGKGYKGASMQIWDAQFMLPLGNPKILDADGIWSIDLAGLELRTTEIKAIQSFNSRDSEASNIVKFDVTVLPPQITVPIESGHLPRISTLSGKGVEGALVTVWLQGESEPLLNQVLVNDQGIWSAMVILPVGRKVIRCQQRFANITSKDSPLRTYDVVPAAPVIETPVAGEHVGRRVVVSGFGVPGDSVTVALGSATNPLRQSSPVLEDRTWSVTLEIDHPGGDDTLQAFASYSGFTSDAAERALRLGTYQPSIDLPAPGQWVSHPVIFSGQGRPGVGQLVSWFNPEQVWVPNIAVTAAGWQCEAQQALPPGGQWCRFRQTLSDGADGATQSDWVDSERFEIEPPAT